VAASPKRLTSSETSAARTATPLLEVMRRCPALLAMVFGARVGETMQFNNTSVFAPHYATLHLRISPSVFLGAITIANLVSLVWIPAFGGLSDKTAQSRRRSPQLG